MTNVWYTGGKPLVLLTYMCMHVSCGYTDLQKIAGKRNNFICILVCFRFTLCYHDLSLYTSSGLLHQMHALSSEMSNNSLMLSSVNEMTSTWISFASHEITAMFFPRLQPKTLVKPDDQLELTEKELKEEITRVLTADNPHAPDNLIRFNFKENAFKHVPHIDHFAMHFSLDGWVQSHI